MENHLSARRLIDGMMEVQETKQVEQPQQPATQPVAEQPKAAKSEPVRTTANKAVKPDEHSDFFIQGEQAANKVVEAENEAKSIMRFTVYDAAKDLADDSVKTENWLAGYAKGFISNGYSSNTSYARKSEARAVFNAIKAKGINVVAPLAEQLAYMEFVTKCRELIAPKAENLGGDTTASPSVKPRKINDEEMSKIRLRLIDGDTLPTTAASMLTAAAAAVTKKAGNGPLAAAVIIRQIQNMAISLHGNADRYIDEWSKRVDGMAQEALDKLEEQRKANDLAKAKADADEKARQADERAKLIKQEQERVDRENAAKQPQQEKAA